MKTIISDFEAASAFCSSEIIKLIAKKPDAVLAFSGEPCLYGLFDALASSCEKQKADFSRVKFFSITEIAGSRSMAEIIERRLLSRINAAEDNIFLLSEDNFAEYDDIIGRSGGIDALFMGIGMNAGIGFNGSGTPFSSLTHIAKLSSFTKDELRYLPSVSDRGLTMGIKTITAAKNIYVAAFGSDRSKAVFKMLYARNDPATPAAFLQIPMNVTVLLDREASSEI